MQEYWKNTCSLCEEIILIKHKSNYSCESSIFFDLPPKTVMENCQFEYFFNITVNSSILDGGNKIILANMNQAKRLIYSSYQDLTKPLSDSNYALVDRSILY